MKKIISIVGLSLLSAGLVYFLSWNDEVKEFKNTEENNNLIKLTCDIGPLRKSNIIWMPYIPLIVTKTING